MDHELPPGAPSSVNLPFVEDLYYEWLRDPTAVDAAWAAWFASLEPAPGATPPPGPFAGIAPWVSTTSVLRAGLANEKVNIACIGVAGKARVIVFANRHRHGW